LRGELEALRAESLRGSPVAEALYVKENVVSQTFRYETAIEQQIYRVEN
jgi:hypothetical protein